MFPGGIAIQCQTPRIALAINIEPHNAHGVADLDCLRVQVVDPFLDLKVEPHQPGAVTQHHDPIDLEVVSGDLGATADLVAQLALGRLGLKVFFQPIVETRRYEIL